LLTKLDNSYVNYFEEVVGFLELLTYNELNGGDNPSTIHISSSTKGIVTIPE
jgi:hypothetical protein